MLCVCQKEEEEKLVPRVYMQSSKDFLSLSLSVHHPRQIQISTTLNNNNNFFLFAFSVLVGLQN